MNQYEKDYEEEESVKSLTRHSAEEEMGINNVKKCPPD